MDINVEWINNLFRPYDFKHLLLVYALMTALLFITFMIISASGIYTSRKNFWSIVFAVLADAYLLSGISYFVFHLNVIFTLMIVLCLAFIALGDIGLKEKATPLEDWWLYLFVARKRKEPKQTMLLKNRSDWHSY